MDDICSICNKSIRDGEARYTGDERRDIFRHWDCYEPELRKHEAFVKELLGEKPRRKSPVRPGDGPVAQRIAKKLVVCVKEELGYDVSPDDFKFWVQAPAHSGPRWDLAVWGADLTHPEHPNIKISFHSWDTMSKLVKFAKLSIHSDGPGSFDVGEG